MIFKVRDVITEYIYYLYDHGFLDEYSEQHFLIQAMNGKVDFFDRYPHLVNELTFFGNNPNIESNFLMNFSPKLKFLANKFPENDILSFVKNQLAAGKENYDEEQFFRALSEVHVLLFLCTFGPGFEKAIYEPKLNGGQANPEARLLYMDDIVVDVEVKTPGFTKTYEPESLNKLVLKPNVILPPLGIEKMQEYCNQNDIQLVFPRVKKFKDFIESAAKKFAIPSDEKHFNLLFINWTYTDFPDAGLQEPISLLINPISGILSNEKACELIGLDSECLKKISAIILYRDNINSILFGDFRFHWQHISFALINNRKMFPNLRSDLLWNILHMNPYNYGDTIEWWPVDFLHKKNISDHIVEKACNYVHHILWESDEVIQCLFPGISSKEIRNNILLEEYIKKDKIGR